MRFLIPLAVLAAAQIGAAWALGDVNIARPGGTFATAEAETPAACERLCADDTLCMAWSFQANSCELKAVVPAAITRDGVISGVSSRAPAAMRVRFEDPPVPAATIAAAHELDTPDAPAAEAAPEDDVSLALLGGPESDEGLRTRLGN